MNDKDAMRLRTLSEYAGSLSRDFCKNNDLQVDIHLYELAVFVADWYHERNGGAATQALAKKVAELPRRR